MDFVVRPSAVSGRSRQRNRPFASPAGESGGVPLRVALLDSGIHPHPELEGRLAGFLDLTQGRSEPYDDYGHGTHLAGLILRPDRYGMIASWPGPSWELVVVKVLNREGVGRESVILRGIEWCVQERVRLGIRVLNLSLGGNAEASSREDPLCRAVEEAWSAGLVVVTTAGNEGFLGPGGIRSPGTSPLVITVGALNRRRRVASFSSLGPTADGHPKPDLVAPGVAVISWRAPGSYLDRRYPRARLGEAYFRQTGSSVATAVVSGQVAGLLSVRPELTPDGVKELLKRRAVDIGADRRAQGAGALEPRRLLGLDPEANDAAAGSFGRLAE